MIAYSSVNQGCSDSTKGTVHLVPDYIATFDFDTTLSNEKCLENVVKNAKTGSIIVFHDSEKAAERMRYGLSGTLEYFAKAGYRFEKIVYNLKRRHKIKAGKSSYSFFKVSFDCKII